MLVVAPHPDDEAIGAFGLVRRMRRRGGRVRVLVVSDGAASHQASRRWPRARLIAERRRETRRVMRRAGLAASAIRFLGLPDGGLGQLTACESGRIAGAVRRLRGVTLLVAPSAEDAHPDHRAVAAILARVALPGARRLAYLVWPHRRRARRGAAMRIVIDGGAAAKRSAIRGYATQTGAIRDDARGFAIAPHELAAFAHPIERYAEHDRPARRPIA